MRYSDMWRSQFSSSNFLINFQDVNSFYKSRWWDSVLPYAIYRTTVFIYVLSMMIYAPVKYSHGAKFLIYATYWSYLTLTLGTLASAVNVWVYYATRNHEGADSHRSLDIKWNVKLQWVAVNIYSASAFVVTINYMLFLFDGDPSGPSINIHMLNSVLVIVDLFISRTPIRLLHFYQPINFFVSYSAFTVAFWALGGTDRKGHRYIYKSLNYSTNPGRSAGLIMALSFVLAPLCHLIVFILFTIREWIWFKIAKRRQYELNSNIVEHNL